MIAVKIQGRLGNQLFQYAFAYSIAKKLHTSFYLDQSEQKFVLQDYFELPSKFSIFLEDHIFSIQGYHNFFSHYIKKRFYQLLKKHFTFNKATFKVDSDYRNLLSEIKNHTLYEGYFQSEAYFIKYEFSIRRIFSLKTHIKKQYKRKYIAYFKEKKIITVHIRKGDYKELGNLNLGNDDISLPMTYYHKILSSLQSTNSLFVFISDDVDFVSSQFNYLDNKLISNDNMINDFQHLLNADTCVIANSTFSWWGAWLNNNPQKKVYAPKYFLGHHINKTWPPDIYPPEWIIVNF